MLSFQKEQSAASKNDNENMPAPSVKGSAGGEDSQQYYTVSDKKQQLKQSTYLLVVLFVVGAICLWFMIRKSTPAVALASQSDVAKGEQSQIEAAIARITGIRSQMFSGLERIVKKFYEFANFEQVNVGELSKNPFQIDSGLGELKPSDGQNQMAIDQSQLELLTIMATEKGYCCMINGKLLDESDNIQGLKVVQITDNTVTLQSGEAHIVLRLEESF